jgi:hypothetical protein
LVISHSCIHLPDIFLFNAPEGAKQPD